MRWTLDHVPFACRDLDAMSARFDDLGLSPTYGGVHDNDVTHMSLLGFEDGSYLELIAERTSGEHAFWPDHIRADAGPAAWCVRVPDIADACGRMLDRGIAVDGPRYGSRTREDGILVEWDIARFGTDERQLVLPFAIADRTPLEYRVTRTESGSSLPVTGLEQVVVAVHDLESTNRWFRERFRFPRPRRASVAGLGTVASYPGQPLALVGGEETDWVADRLERLPPGPCSCLIGTTDLDAAAAALPLGPVIDWPDGRVAFVDDAVIGSRLGVVERDTEREIQHAASPI